MITKLVDLDTEDKGLIHDMIYGNETIQLIHDITTSLNLAGTGISNEFEFMVGVAYAYSLMSSMQNLRDKYGRDFVECNGEAITKHLNTYMDFFKSEIRRSLDRQKALT